MHSSRGDSLLFRGSAAVVLVVLGALLGGWMARWVPPTRADVREAARSLVPPSVVVSEETAGTTGAFPAEGPYTAGIRTLGGSEQSHAERVEAFRSQAQQEGWRLVSSETLANAEAFRYERNGITGNVSVRIDPPSTAISTRRTNDSRMLPLLVCGSIGAALGLGAWASLTRVAGRRR